MTEFSQRTLRLSGIYAQPASPIFYGYNERTIPVRYADGPLLQVPEQERDRAVLMRFPGSEKSVLSGLMKNPAEIRNRPAIVDMPAGKGCVLLFTTNPCYKTTESSTCCSTQSSNTTAVA